MGKISVYRRTSSSALVYLGVFVPLHAPEHWPVTGPVCARCTTLALFFPEPLDEYQHHDGARSSERQTTG